VLLASPVGFDALGFYPLQVKPIFPFFLFSFLAAMTVGEMDGKVKVWENEEKSNPELDVDNKPSQNNEESKFEEDKQTGGWR